MWCQTPISNLNFPNIFLNKLFIFPHLLLFLIQFYTPECRHFSLPQCVAECCENWVFPQIKSHIAPLPALIGSHYGWALTKGWRFLTHHISYRCHGKKHKIFTCDHQIFLQFIGFLLLIAFEQQLTVWGLCFGQILPVSLFEYSQGVCGFHGDPNEPLLAAVFVLVLLFFVSLKGFYTTDIQSCIQYFYLFQGYPYFYGYPHERNAAVLPNNGQQNLERTTQRPQLPLQVIFHQLSFSLKIFTHFIWIKMNQKPIFLK